jgi:hypothetical protein
MEPEKYPRLGPKGRRVVDDAGKNAGDGALPELPRTN